MAKIKVLYEKIPPKSRTGKRPGGICYDYSWAILCKLLQEVREKNQALTATFFKPGEAEVTQVIVGDDGVTFYLEPKRRTSG